MNKFLILAFSIISLYPTYQMEGTFSIPLRSGIESYSDEERIEFQKIHFEIKNILNSAASQINDVLAANADVLTSMIDADMEEPITVSLAFQK